MPPRKRKNEPAGWQGLYNSRPMPSECGQCRAPIFTAHIDGLHERLDIVPLSPVGELAALLQGSRTFLWTNTHPKLWRRTPHAIRTRPDPSFGVVLRIHRCHNHQALEPPFAATFDSRKDRYGDQPDF